MPWLNRIRKRSSLFNVSRELDPAMLAFEYEIAKAFFKGINGLSGVAGATQALQEAINSGNPQDILDMFSWVEFEDRVTNDIRQTVQEIIDEYGTESFDTVIDDMRARATPTRGSGGPPSPPPDFLTNAPGEPGRGGFKADLRFDMTNPLAIARAEQLAGRLVREVSGSTRAAIQEAVANSFKHGLTVEDLATALKHTVGLTTRQAASVKNYVDRLVPQVGKDKAEAMGARYFRQTLNRRVMTIARTEVMRASNDGRQQGWLAAADAGALDRVGTRKKWISAHGGNRHGGPCELCWPMNGEIVVGLETEFLLPNLDGVQMPPAHPNAVFEGSTFVGYGITEELVRARYNGPAVRVSAGSHVTTIGPNHPMLTRRGMVRAADLHEGDELIYDRRVEETRLDGVSELDFQQVILVEDAFDACLAVGCDTSIASSGHDLHGDRTFCEGEVQVVVTKDGLLIESDSCGLEERREGFFMETDVNAIMVTSHSASDLRCGGIAHSTTCPVGCFGSGGAHFKFLSITEVMMTSFVGWAYDATTSSSLYCSDGFVVSNCRCTAVALPAEILDDFKGDLQFTPDQQVDELSGAEYLSGFEQGDVLDEG